MIVIGIDPGPLDGKGAYAIMDVGVWPPELVAFAKTETSGLAQQADYDLVTSCGIHARALVIVERPASMGMPAGETTWSTALAAGEVLERFRSHQMTARYIRRADVKLSLCGSSRAKDGNVVQAICDLYGGNIKSVKGTRKAPGPLYGVAADVWQAIAAGLAGFATFKGHTSVHDYSTISAKTPGN